MTDRAVELLRRYHQESWGGPIDLLVEATEFLAAHDAAPDAQAQKARLADSLLKPNYYMPSDIVNAWEKHKDAYDAIADSEAGK